MEFSLRLKELREDRDLSQAELAKDLEVGTGSVGMWESTDRVPPSKKLIKIAEYFGCTTDYLLGYSDNKYPMSSGLSHDEREILALYQTLSPSRKEDLKIYLRALSGSTETSTTKKKA